MQSHCVEEVTAWVAYCGALLIPAAYVLFSGLRARMSRRLLIAGGTQLALTGLLVFLGSRPGNPEAYLWAGPLILLNLVALAYYLYLLLRPKKSTNDQA